MRDNQRRASVCPRRVTLGAQNSIPVDGTTDMEVSRGIDSHVGTSNSRDLPESSSVPVARHLPMHSLVIDVSESRSQRD